MTVRYTLDVSTSKPWTLFKLLFKWKGSFWKLVAFELIVWLILYAIISLVYRLGLEGQRKRDFERLVDYLDTKLDYIPLDFMLGFFVTSLLNRWTTFFINIGYTDNIALMSAAYIRGNDEKTRKIRRNIVRYCVLSQVLVFRDISIRARKRFPTLDAVVAAGFMMEHEKEKFEVFSQFRYNRYWLPFQWALSLCDEARRQQKISSDYLLEKLGEEIKLFRTNMATLGNFDWVPLPIMYPQLIIIAVHAYFLVCTVARQFITSEDAPNKTKIDIYFPVMTTLQFIFYMGWHKIAEVIMNPFGEDDDDFECNFLLDKNLAIGLKIVDDGYGKTPQILKDQFWSKPIEPLYTAQAIHSEKRTPGITGSAANIVVSEQHHARMIQLFEDLFHHSHAEHPTKKGNLFATTKIQDSQSAVHLPSMIHNVKDRFGRQVWTSLSHSHVYRLSARRKREFPDLNHFNVTDHGLTSPESYFYKENDNNNHNNSAVSNGSNSVSGTVVDFTTDANEVELFPSAIVMSTTEKHATFILPENK